jgi:hypothetical protein
MTAIDWLWPERFALGKLGLLVGLPDEGKGQIFADIAARVTKILLWPCGEGVAPQGNVILLSAEDAPGDTVVPRLAAAGADLDRIEIVSMVVNTDAKERMFSLATDLALLRRKIAEVGKVKLVLIDPISAYLGVGKIDSFRTTDVRAVLAPVVDLAADLNVAIIGIMHFNKKTDVSNALLRISDSAMSSPWLTTRKTIASCSSKQNTISLGEAMQPTTGTKSPAARDEAKKFLLDLLSSGQVPSSDVEDAAKGNGIAVRTLNRAKTDLDIVAKKNGPNGTWTWSLPEQKKHWNDD